MNLKLVDYTPEAMAILGRADVEVRKAKKGVPKSWPDAMKDPAWLKAMKREVHGILVQGVVEIVDDPRIKNPSIKVLVYP